MSNDPRRQPRVGLAVFDTATCCMRARQFIYFPPALQTAGRHDDADLLD